MKSNNYEICYLCSKEIKSTDNKSKDHVIPKQFINRKQAIVKGFDYGSFLTTHLDCNNKFGGSKAKAEVICQKALTLIDVFQNPNNHNIRTYSSDSKTKLIFINIDKLEHFSNRDKEYFGLIDVTNNSINEIRDPEFYIDKKAIKHMEKPTNISLSVIAKSSVALLVKRYNVSPKSIWRLIVRPCFIHSESIDLSFLFDKIIPFDDGLNILIKPFESNDWFIAFQYSHIVVFIFVSMNGDISTIDKVCNAFFLKKESYYFQSQKLIDLVKYNWLNNRIDNINLVEML